VRRLWDAGSRGDADAFYDLYAPNSVLRAHGAKHLDMQYFYLLSIERGRIMAATLVPTDQRRNDEFWRSH
jgi:ketosteroid isomerase-like protein